LVIFLGDSSDGTEAVCRDLAPFLPVKTEIVSTSDLGPGVRRKVVRAQERNDGLFNEGMWSLLMAHRPIRTRFYAGIHIDVEFVAGGLWDFLCERLGRSTIAGIFDPGELIESGGRYVLSLPRFFPLVTIAHSRRAEALAITWGRGGAAPKGRAFFADNGAIALQRALRGGVSLFREEELRPFLRHFGYVWTKVMASAIHGSDGLKSRDAVSSRLAVLRHESAESNVTVHSRADR
jgi:hypothetical protein